MFFTFRAASPSGLTAAGRIGLAALLTVAALAVPALAASGDSPQLVNNQYLIVLDQMLSPDDILLNLGKAGFPSVERVPGLPARFGNYRLVNVGAANAATRQQLMQVPGVRAVRPVYQAAGKRPYPILAN